MKSLFIITFVCSSILLCAQPKDQLFYRGVASHRVINYFPDSIRMEFPKERAFVVLEMSNFRVNSSLLENLSGTLKEIQEYISKSYVPSPGEHGGHTVNVQIKSNGVKEIIIRPAPETTQLTVKDQQIVQLLPPGWEMYIHTEDAKMYLYMETLQDLTALADQHYKDIRSTLTEQLKNLYIGRKGIKARFIIQDKKIEFSEIKYEQPTDLIFLTGSAGVGVFQNKVYPELSASLGFIFGDRFNRRNRKVDITFSSMYFAQSKTEGGYSSNVNSFLSVAYSENHNKKSARPMWIGIGAGLLVNRSGNYFTGKTARFFLTKDIGSPKLNLVPEFYLTDDFKKFQFGLKLSYSF